MVKEQKGYIDRARLMDDLFHATVVMGSTDFLQVIRKQPTADVAPVVHGQWEIIEDDILCDTWIKCSVCGNEHETAYEQDLSSYLYCPNCGAKMDLEVSDG